MSVKIVRLSSGEEIVCSCEVDGDIYKIKKPAILIPTGKGTLGLMPWLAYADLSENTIEIDKKFVVFIIDPQNDLLNEYNTAFGSGLFVPASPSGVQAPVGFPAGSSDTSLAGKNPALKLSK